ncbi:hypothetical protein Tco_1541999 [Tanacetum coccineum]
MLRMTVQHASDLYASNLKTTPLLEVLRMISEVVLQVLVDHKSILYGLRSEIFGVEFCVELKQLPHHEEEGQVDGLVDEVVELEVNLVIRIILIRASWLKKEMADKETKSTMRDFAANDQADYYSGITSIVVNGKNAYELKGKFFDDLDKNAFSRTHGEDTVEHIEYFLKIVDPIDLPNVNRDKLRVVVFPISLAGDA